MPGRQPVLEKHISLVGGVKKHLTEALFIFAPGLTIYHQVRHLFRDCILTAPLLILLIQYLWMRINTTSLLNFAATEPRVSAASLSDMDVGEKNGAFDCPVTAVQGPLIQKHGGSWEVRAGPSTSPRV